MKSREPKGSAYERRGQFFIRVTVGPQDRRSEHAPWAASLEQAAERGRILQSHVNRLRAAKRVDFIARVIEVGAKADDVKLAALANAVEGMLEGALVKASTVTSHLISVEADAWIAATSNFYDERTVATFKIYARHWARFFADDVHAITKQAIEAYINDRLGHVVRLTVKKELWGLRTFVQWAVDARILPAMPMWPKLSKKAVGTRSGRQRAKIVELTQEDVERILVVLPAHVRPRYTFAAETGLRPGTLDGISVPEHYKRGAAMLSITADIDKNRYSRDVPLTLRARAVLDAVAPERGLVFGPERYIDAFKEAVKLAGLPKETAPYDLRHARATHDVEVSGNITGVAFLLGHKQVTTTNRYVHADKRSAEAVLTSRNRAALVGDQPAAAAAASVAEGRLTTSQRRESPRKRAKKARSGTSGVTLVGVQVPSFAPAHLDAISDVKDQELPPRPPPSRGGNAADAADEALQGEAAAAMAEGRFDDARTLMAVLERRAKARSNVVLIATAKKRG